MPFPPFDAFGGSINMRQRLPTRRVTLPTATPLPVLNSGPGRIVDTYKQDYARLVRDNPAPFAVLSEEQKNTRVAVIGAGISGLCAVYELLRCGLQPDLYEARSDVGGRLDSRRFTSPDGGSYVAEMGAMRFPDTSKLLWHYYTQIRRLNNKPVDIVLETFPNPGKVVTALNVEGPTNLWISDPAEPNFALPPRVSRIKDQFIAVLDASTTFQIDGETVTLPRIARILKQADLTPQDERLVNVYWSHVIELFDGYSLERFVREKLSVPPYSWQEKDFRLFAAVGLGTGGYGQDFPTSFIDFLRYDAWAYESLYQLPDASNDIAQYFVGACVQLGWRNRPIMQPAWGLRREPNGTITFQVGVDGTPVNYDYVIVATANPAMVNPLLFDVNEADGPFSANINLQSPTNVFCYGIRESLRHLTVYPSTKVWALTVKPFNFPGWPKDSQGRPLRWILSDREAGQTAYFDPPGQYSPVLVTYQNGFDATRYGGIGAPVVVGEDGANPSNQLLRDYVGMKMEATTTEIGETVYHATKDGSTGQVFRVDWHNEPYINGGFRLALPGQYTYNATLAFQYLVGGDVNIDNAYKRVFFAGETAFFLDGWVEGGLHAAVNAASAVLDQITSGGSRMKAILSPDMWQFGRPTAEFWDDRML